MWYIWAIMCGLVGTSIEQTEWLFLALRLWLAGTIGDVFDLRMTSAFCGEQQVHRDTPSFGCLGYA